MQTRQRETFTQDQRRAFRLLCEAEQEVQLEARSESNLPNHLGRFCFLPHQSFMNFKHFYLVQIAKSSLIAQHEILNFSGKEEKEEKR
jgi:hypothetical protein